MQHVAHRVLTAATLGMLMLPVCFGKVATVLSITFGDSLLGLIIKLLGVYDGRAAFAAAQSEPGLIRFVKAKGGRYSCHGSVKSYSEKVSMIASAIGLAYSSSTKWPPSK